jgi:hypothetical protein
VKNFVFERKKNDNFYAYVTKVSVSALVVNDNEKMYHVPDFYLKGEYIVFYVNTTNDESQSNCKYIRGDMITNRLTKAGEEMNDSNTKYTPEFMTIKTTRLIKKGEELLLFCKKSWATIRSQEFSGLGLGLGF